MLTKTDNTKLNVLPGLVGLSKSYQDLPYFQQLQLQFTAHIRHPQRYTYQPANESPIENRRLKVYEELFFNNIQDFFRQIFPVCKSILGEPRWALLIREYMFKHQAQTPLFHQLGEEFLAFLQNEFVPLEEDPKFLLELAHYEWVELALSVLEESGFEKDSQLSIDLDSPYKVSPLAWLLAYEWPVHQLSKENQIKQKPKLATTLLVYRESSENESIVFMELSPLLYQWLNVLDGQISAKQALLNINQNHRISHGKTDSLEQTKLLEFASQSLHDLQSLGIVKRG